LNRLSFEPPPAAPATRRLPVPQSTRRAVRNRLSPCPSGPPALRHAKLCLSASSPCRSRPPLTFGNGRLPEQRLITPTVRWILAKTLSGSKKDAFGGRKRGPSAR